MTQKTKEPTKTQFIAWTRIGSREQRSDSLDRQVDALRAFALVQRGELVKIILTKH